ncbi:VCBS repeat-containing protein [Fulvivirga sedimenti]|uniref:VCBS repeat-containing protein n=1 Tax=Fulvivirga sedimenti TaxID=2879465 RepID=A0A9X1L243_9BACT|nr:VCBS repeat-containing protein [Fulvivirga sedimenti]MCA6078917.1 VCBS repeat-containing protein [Fulvivirga sedimenti]
MKRVLILVMAAQLILSCQKKEEHLFELLKPEDTGVTFNNFIKEDRNYNILDIYYLYNGGGVSVGDFDNNGFTDLFFTGNMVENRLYLNQGNMKFRDVTEVAGIGAPGKWSYGSSVVDINGDGLLDIYVSSSISADPKERTNMFFINQGVNEDGIPVFKDEAGSFGLDVDNHSTHASFFDYDQDGDLDVLVISNSKIEGIPSVYKTKVNDGSSPINDQLFRNNGDGTFTEVSTEAGITSEGFALGISTVDFNKDGTVDVYVGNDFITNDLLYVNKNGKFTEMIDSAIHHQSRFSMGNDAADINNDGHVDIITLDMLPESNLRKKTVIIPNGYIVYINDFKYGYTHQYVRNMLQVNNGNMTFSEIGQIAGVHQTEWSWSPLFADFDNDGFKDLVVTNGYPRDITDLDFINFRMETSGFTSTEDLLKEIPSVKIPNYAFQNNGDLTFSDVSAKWGFTQPSFSNGAAYADLDNDGDLDYIVNNINDPAFIYENTLYHGEPSDNHYLRVKLNGSKENPSAFGAKVTITYDGNKQQYSEQNVYRGYISTVEDILHFGLGTTAVIETLTVIWPNQRITTLTNVPADQVLQLNIEDAGQNMQGAPGTDKETLLSRVNSSLNIDYVHEESDYIDYNVQPSIPHKFSQFGPALAVGDLNGDGLDDYFTGGSTGYDGSIFVQQKDGTFKQIAGGLNEQKDQEDMGALIFDADGDGDNDIYVVSGGFEFPEGSVQMRDRLYINDGKGNLAYKPEALPDLRISSSCVRGADYDADGDIDLFVGGRVIVGSFPLSPNSTILQNQGNGTFKDVTASIGKEISEAGMITDAIWSDFDGDDDVDLIAVGEYMPITIFENNNGTFNLVATPDLNKTGLWNSIAAGDFDGDGDTDYIAGNVGINNFYCATPETPLKVIAKDFDSNGDLDAIMSCYFKAEDGTMQPFPIQSWQQLSGQSPIFRSRFSSYQEYGRTRIDQLLTPEEMDGAVVLSVDYLHTSYIENLGNGRFSVKQLPLEAQVAPVNGISVGDFNNDDKLDVMMVGNDYGNEVNMGQYDAMIGLVLLGDGQGGFAPQSVLNSGFMVRGDAKALVRLAGAEGYDVYLASQNRGPVEAYSVTNQRIKHINVGPADFKAILTYADGHKQLVELTYGQGFLSQSTRKLSVSENVSSVELVDFTGNRRTIDLK